MPSKKHKRPILTIRFRGRKTAYKLHPGETIVLEPALGHRLAVTNHGDVPVFLR